MNVSDLLLCVSQITRAVEGEIGAIGSFETKDYLATAFWSGERCEGPILCVGAVDLLQFERGLGPGWVASSRTGIRGWSWCGWCSGVACPVIAPQRNALGDSWTPDTVYAAGCTAGVWTALACCLVVAAAEAAAAPSFRTPTISATLAFDRGAAVPLAVLICGATSTKN